MTIVKQEKMKENKSPRILYVGNPLREENPQPPAQSYSRFSQLTLFTSERDMYTYRESKSLLEYNSKFLLEYNSKLIRPHT
ncbi:hypothetical protein Sjap_007422 [Stephania japonica]|uniref:Uncharacterized protein n=1 Tax=Stephania japonica TaxID=461633 RepID=A0AAP0JMN5_9MAGN